MNETALAKKPVCWEELSWPEIRDLVHGHPREVALLPVGATEQHGPHLPTGTDTIIARALCHAVSSRTGRTRPACAPHRLQLRPRDRDGGHAVVSPERLSDLIRDAVEWVAASGISRVLAVNGHFGNQGALAVAGDHLRHERPALRFGVLNWWTLTPAVTRGDPG